MLRDIRYGVAAVGLTGVMLLGVASVFPAAAALDSDVRVGIDSAVIDDPTNAAEIAAEAAANVCPPDGAAVEVTAVGLADVREVFRAVAERAIIEQDPSDPAPAAAIAEAVIAACPKADEVVASELETLIQTAAGGLLPPPGPGEQGINLNSPVEQNREAFVKSPNTTRLGPTSDIQELTQEITPARPASPPPSERPVN